MSGTTIQDMNQVPRAFERALVEYGITLSHEQMKAVRGGSKRQALLKLIPPGRDQMNLVEKVYRSFHVHLEQIYNETGVLPVAGAEELFGILRERGMHIVLNTGFDRETTEFLLKRLKWTGNLIDGFVCSDDVRSGRPAPYMIFHAMETVGVESVHNVANVGDTALDLRAGHNAGVRWNIGVLTGAHDRESLEKEPHTHILQSVADLLTLGA